MDITKVGFISFYTIQLGLFIYMFNSSENDHRDKYIFILLLFPIFFGFRSLNVGTDSWAYYDYYIYQHTFMEPVFTFFSSIVFKTGLSYHYFFLLISLSYFLPLILSYKIFLDNQKIAILAVLFHYLLPYSVQMNINIIRQGLSFSFLLFSFNLLWKYNKTDYSKKRIYLIFAILFSLLSIFTHNSAVVIVGGVFFLGMILKNVELRKLPYIFILVSLISYSNSIQFFLRLFDNMFDISFINRALSYSVTNPISLIPKQIFYLFLVGFFIVKLQDKYKNVGELMNSLPYHALSLLVLLLSMIMSFSYHASLRILIFADFLIPILILNFLNELSLEKKYIGTVFSFGIFMALLILIVFFSNFFVFA